MNRPVSAKSPTMSSNLWRAGSLSNRKSDVLTTPGWSADSDKVSRPKVWAMSFSSASEYARSASTTALSTSPPLIRPCSAKDATSFMKEVASLAEQGLIKGGDVDNAVVLAERAYSEAELKDIAQTLGRDTLSESADHPGVVSTSDLRFDNEPARHKLLDIVGDLALTGRFIHG